MYRQYITLFKIFPCHGIPVYWYPRSSLGNLPVLFEINLVQLLFSFSFSTAYMSHFEPRDLRALSVEPLLVYPTHYTGEPGYFSDTETSTIWDDEAVNTDWDRSHAQKTSQQERIWPIAQNSVTGETPPPAARASRDELWKDSSKKGVCEGFWSLNCVQK